MSDPTSSVDLHKKKLREKLAVMRGRRTGVTLRQAKNDMAKKQKNELLRDVRKQGVRALTKKLGVNDPEVDKMVANMIRTGEVKDADELVKRIGEVQAKKKLEDEAKSMSNDKLPAELDNVASDVSAIPSLPGANPKRAALKPLSRALAQQPKGFQEWLEQGK